MTEILARVQHVPARGHLLPALTAALAPLPVEVITDPDGNGPWHTYRRCLTDPTDATHLLVVQDDAVPCRNLAAVLPAIAARAPDRPVALWLGGSPRRTARATLRAPAGTRYVPLGNGDWLPCVAVLWPTALARAAAAWADANPRKLAAWPAPPRSDDGVLQRWLVRTRQTALVTVPSLVEHPDREPSHVRRERRDGGDPGRVALRFIGDQDPAELEW